MTGLQKRLLSAAILLPVAIAALWLGAQVWTALIFIFALAMAWEWCTICVRRRLAQEPYPDGALTLAGIVMLATVVAALLPVFMPFPFPWPSNLSIVVAGAALAVIAAWPRNGPKALWFGLGVLYVVPASLAAVAIRAQAGDGLPTEIWIVALVVAADTGAYVAGRSIGGPKLAPRISPNKTWAGLAGAIVSAGIIGAVTAVIIGRPSVMPLTLVSGLLAIVEQGGDLFESYFKRHFGVKDSGRIIPGHGGVLDRVDGLLAVILAVAGLELALGEGIFAWL
ncbi:MAG TPA: phosphatidate cytidylyltransferase [Dongiaceae bacterium]|nr:phosphatidate cytidylyltransferase [Dongiaceae bacterium]